MTNGNDSIFQCTKKVFNKDAPRMVAGEMVFGAYEDELIKGLTKREYFAAMALQGLLSNGDGPADVWIADKGMGPVAQMAVECADALIKALNKKP